MAENNNIENQDEVITSEDQKTGRTGKMWNSLRFKIAIFYLILAITNIVFFSVVILENQTDLLMSNFGYNSNELVRTVLDDMGELKISRENPETWGPLKTVLKSRQIEKFEIFDKEGNILIREGESSEQENARVDEGIKQRSIQLATSATLFRARYDLKMDEDDFSVDFILPVGASEDELFLHTKLSVRAIQDRLRSLYVQIALAVGWGVLFHLLFAIFVYRVIFIRVGLLKDASENMAEELSTRVTWDMKRNDELDDLGQAFNNMASRIQNDVETIQTQMATIERLNEQIQSELEIGKDVQELFLPKKNIFNDYGLEIFWRPLREVSGDVYKFYQYSRGSKGLFFADASGHGVSAAMITAITIMSLDSVVRKANRPGQILSRLNDILAVRLESSFFATGVYCMVDSQNRIHFSNAGHNPVLYIHGETGEIEELSKDGPPLGMMEGVEYETHIIEAKPGDQLFIYSDGLVEPKNDKDEMFELDRVKDIILGNRDKPKSEIIKIIADQLEEHTVEYMDDVSILYLEMPS